MIRARLRHLLIGGVTVLATSSAATVLVAAPEAHASVVTTASGVTVAQPHTSLTYTSEPGDFVGAGRHEVLRAGPVYTVTVSGDHSSLHLSVHNADYSTFWDVFVAPGAGDVLRPGTFPGAARYPFQAGRAPGLSMDGDGRGCNQSYGSFAVNQIAFDDAGAVTMADVTFVQHCETPTAPALRGTLHFQALPLSYLQTSDAGDYVGQGVSKRYLGSTSILTVSGTATGFSAGVSGLGDGWNITAAAKSGRRLVVGQTYATTRFGDASHAALDVTGDGRGCNSSTGSLTITALTVTKGAITALSVSFVQHCEGAVPALRGTLHYGA